MPGELIFAVCFVDETKDVQTLYDDREKKPSQLEGKVPGYPHALTRLPMRLGEPQAPLPVTLGFDADTLHNCKDLEQRRLSKIPSGCKLGWSNSLRHSPLPLDTWREARLMKYYVEYMSSWVGHY